MGRILDDSIKKVRHILDDEGLTQVALAKGIGKNRVYLSSIFTGVRKPGPATAYKICRFLNFRILPDELIYGRAAVEAYRNIDD